MLPEAASMPHDGITLCSSGVMPAPNDHETSPLLLLLLLSAAVLQL
jgi:hypothetical protein